LQAISKKEILYSTLINKNFKEFTWWVKILLDLFDFIAVNLEVNTERN
jgi:hypothetical protein